MAKKDSKMNAQGRAMGMDKSYQAEDDLRILISAEEIREDSKRLAAAKALAKEKLIDIAKIADVTGEAKEPGDKD